MIKVTFKSRFRLKLIRWFDGRYGINDLLNKHLFWLGFILIIASAFIPFEWFILFPLGILFVAYGRLLSKKTDKRKKELERYYRFLSPIFYFRTKIKQRKDYRFLVCKECKQRLRVPKHKGKIEVCCPKCHTKRELNT